MSRGMNLAAALCAAATLAGLALAGCTIDATGTGPAASGGGGPGGAGPGSGGGMTTTTTSTGGQGGMGGMGVEDCLDGVDNDGDGDADCADTDCNAGFECVPAPPAGWDDLVRVEQVAFPAANPAPECLDGTAAATLYAVPGGPATCAACTCDATAVTCSLPIVTVYAQTNDCTGSSQPFQSDTGSCSNGPNTGFDSTGSCKIGGPPIPVNPAACTTTGGDMTVSPKWQDELHVCPAGTAGGGCGANSVCVPKADPTLDKICVSKSGNDVCPSGWNALDVQAYQDGVDDRMCTQCGCDVTCTGGSVTLHDIGGCAGALVTLSTNCSGTSAITDGGSTVDGQVGTPDPPTCTQSAPMGSVQTMGDTKICCASAPVP